eukprot:TRINITY_DN260_c0_g1_i3.p1 TRINITY_DN260_c0_g1~~TRINITY_DN260_c0_g1_i3.p1  ORF type:complete len:460 (-),score=53.15 TRINITY_DN260_c0_g1_i3:338-1717(-)
MDFIMKFSLLLLLSVNQISCEQLRFGTFPGVSYIIDIDEENGWCKPSFECEIISALCHEVNAGDCSLTVFETLEQRIQSLQDDEVDIVVSRFSVSPERELEVDFVRPYYYSAGAQLFTLPKDQNVLTSFDNLTTFPICMDVGYYASATLTEDYGFFVFPSDKLSALELVEEGYCIATITDSTFILDGFVQSPASPEYLAPYAVAISKEPSWPNLKPSVESVILQLITKTEDGGESFFEQKEAEYLGVVGVQKNKKFAQLSSAITRNGGAYIGQEAEDDIWQAANLTATRSLKDSLQFINSTYEKFCEEGRQNAYDAYQNGTPLLEIPMVYFDDTSYTLLLEAEDTNDFPNTIVHRLGNPFLANGVTSPDIAENNPQFLTTMQIMQDGYLSDKENQKDGAYFVVSHPFDLPQVVGVSLQEQIISPTRVMKTNGWKVMFGKGEEAGRTFFIGCGIGELGDW